MAPIGWAREALSRRVRSWAGPEPDTAGLPPTGRATDLRLLVPALVAWGVVALVLGQPTAQVLGLAGVVAGLGVVLVGYAWRRRSEPGSGRVGTRRLGADRVLPLAVLTVLGTVLCLAGLAAAGAERQAGPVVELARDRATVTVVGTVASDPKALDPPSGRPESAAGVVLRLDVEQVDGRGIRTEVHSPVLVFADRSWLAVRWRERLQVVGRLAPARDPADDVVALLAPSGSFSVLDAPDVVARAAGIVRERFAAATAELPADPRGLLPGLVIGDTSRTPQELDQAMLTTGMTHLSAVSGSNVAIVLTAALGVARLAGLRRRWRPLFAAVLLMGFVILVRPEPSVVRAAAMGAVGLVGLARSRSGAGLPALGAAVLALLCWDPWLARSPGFALSTLATLGLLLFANPWGAAVARYLPRRIRGWGTALAIPVAAQVMCAPVIVLLQGSVSVVGVLANLAAAPFVAPATVLGVGTALLSVVSTTAASWLGWVAALPTAAIAWVAHTGAAAPLATIPWASSAAGAAALAGGSLLILLAGPWLLHHGRRRPLVPLAVVVLGVAGAAPTRTLTWPLTSWAFVACDVGQGDGLVLATAPGHAVVVDTGPDPALMDACLQRLGVAVVDALVLTHYHADHVDGVPGVLHGRLVRAILASPVQDPPYQSQEVHEWAASSGVPVAEVYAGDDLSIDGLTAHAWWPARVIHEGSVPNNASIVLTVHAGGLQLLLLGDVEREAAHAILLELEQDARAPPSFDVVKVAHHGSGNRDDGLYERVRAPVAVVSVGAGNDYGHPAASTMSALQKDGYRVYRTDQSGDVAVRKGADGRVEVATTR